MSRIPHRLWHGQPTGSFLVFGVLPGQDPQVVQAAARLTARMGASLVCVWADQRNIVVERHRDGSVSTVPMDPDGVDDPRRPTEEEKVHGALVEALTGGPTPWRFHYTTGAPARALHEAAEDLDATAIIVGTRKPGFGAWAAEKMDGSVAARLARHQHRPVILIPPPGADRTGERP